MVAQAYNLPSLDVSKYIELIDGAVMITKAQNDKYILTLNRTEKELLCIALANLIADAKVILIGKAKDIAEEVLGNVIELPVVDEIDVRESTS